MMNVLLLLCFFYGLGNAVQDPAPKPESPSIEAFSFLAGHWRGEGFGGVCEEVWSSPLAGTMMGTFRLVKDDKVVFYEIMVLGPDKDGWSLKVKHFSPEFVGWETKADSVRFRYESVKANEARFSGLTMDRDSDALEIRVRMRSNDGEVSWEPIELRRYVPKGE